MRATTMMIAMPFAAALLGFGSVALAAEPIQGNWKTPKGETVSIQPCNEGFCVVVKTGKYAGRQIGNMKGHAASYAGEITDPTNDKTYSGYGTLSGDVLTMQGCVLKVLCRSQSWTRL
jgi:uncharacterized protein (DUF2147 family)